MQWSTNIHLTKYATKSARFCHEWFVVKNGVKLQIIREHQMDTKIATKYMILVKYNKTNKTLVRFAVLSCEILIRIFSSEKSEMYKDSVEVTYQSCRGVDAECARHHQTSTVM